VKLRRVNSSAFAGLVSRCVMWGLVIVICSQKPTEVLWFDARLSETPKIADLVRLR
jgi:hypothetical protein